MLMGRLTLAATAFVLVGVSTPLFAQGSLPDQLAVCARIGKKDARLECYDSIARSASQGVYTSSFGSSSIRTPQGAGAPPPPPPGTPGASPSFGSEQIDRPIAGRPDNGEQKELSATVTAARDNGLSMWSITLADGAIWRMTERNVNFRPPAPNETVTISKGALGGYLMQVGKQANVRVERVR